jgi:hypothetical protein
VCAQFFNECLSFLESDHKEVPLFVLDVFRQCLLVLVVWFCFTCAFGCRSRSARPCSWGRT